MPTLGQTLDLIEQKIRKYGPSGHCNRLIVSEELRKEQIENKPDAEGRQKTRIALETYSPEAYQAWHEMIEMLMEKCGFNPILLVDVLRVMVHLAGDEGIQIAHDQLCQLDDYEQRLREAKRARKRSRAPTAPA